MQINKEMTRRSFLKKGLLGSIFLFLNPFSRKKQNVGDISKKEARYYKNLAG